MLEIRAQDMLAQLELLDKLETPDQQDLKDPLV